MVLMLLSISATTLPILLMRAFLMFVDGPGCPITMTTIQVKVKPCHFLLYPVLYPCSYRLYQLLVPGTKKHQVVASPDRPTANR
jgi:hypothetical protein